MSRKSISRAKPSEPAFTGSKAGSTTNTVPLRHQSALLDEVIINYWRMQRARDLESSTLNDESPNPKLLTLYFR
jgi:hypothetical protein